MRWDMMCWDVMCCGMCVCGVCNPDTPSLASLVKCPSLLPQVNHFPGSWALGRKDLLWRHLAVLRRNHSAAYDFIPKVCGIHAATEGTWHTTLQHGSIILLEIGAVWQWCPACMVASMGSHPRLRWDMCLR